LTLELISSPNVLRVYGEHSSAYYSQFEKRVEVEDCKDVTERTSDQDDLK